MKYKNFLDFYYNYFCKNHKERHYFFKVNISDSFYGYAEKSLMNHLKKQYIIIVPKDFVGDPKMFEKLFKTKIIDTFTIKRLMILKSSFNFNKSFFVLNNTGIIINIFRKIGIYESDLRDFLYLHDDPESRELYNYAKSLKEKKYASNLLSECILDNIKKLKMSPDEKFDNDTWIIDKMNFNSIKYIRNISILDKLSVSNLNYTVKIIKK